MSKSNNPVKVLSTAINRINKGWSKSSWVTKVKQAMPGKKNKQFVYEVCLEGAIFGYCNANERKTVTPAQKVAAETCLDIIKERHGSMFSSIPQFNDHLSTTKDDVLEVCKLAKIRLETGGAHADEEVDELIPKSGML